MCEYKWTGIYALKKYMPRKTNYTHRKECGESQDYNFKSKKPNKKYPYNFTDMFKNRPKQLRTWRVKSGWLPLDKTVLGSRVS